MNKDKEVEVVDPREAKVDLTMEMVVLTTLCKTRENTNGRMKIKARLSGKVVIPTKVEIFPIEEEVILTLEVDFKENVIDVEVKVIYFLNVRVMVKIFVEIL